MHEMERTVVSNTTPLIALALIGRLGLLKELYGEVVIPQGVREEVLAGRPGAAGVIELEQASWISTVSLSESRRIKYLTDLDQGEAEAIALAEELSADLLIIDERIGRQYAKRLGLKLTGTLGILIKAKQKGLIITVQPLIEEMRQGGIRLGEKVVQKALQLAGE
ncbi:MAG: DUF3368 domain-containing protein [bacterium]|nr:DUF3368 domain-containing protein [bacterium]